MLKKTAKREELPCHAPIAERKTAKRRPFAASADAASAGRLTLPTPLMSICAAPRLPRLRHRGPQAHELRRGISADKTEG